MTSNTDPDMEINTGVAIDENEENDGAENNNDQDFERALTFNSSFVNSLRCAVEDVGNSD
jgi:hypothetical protein